MNYPDLKFIKQHIPISDIARELGLSVRGYRMSCWRLENHRNGDSDPSVTFWKKKNRGRCWVCDEHAWSNLDLVMMVLDCDFPAAVTWISERFAVPAAPPGKHLVQRQQWNPTYRVGCGYSRLEWVIRSGQWAELLPSQRSILAVLDTFTDPETSEATISYRGLARYGGVCSHATVRRALQYFVRIGLLEIEHGVGTDGFRSVSHYKLTFSSRRFLNLVNETYRHQREEVELDKAFRASERKRLRRQKALTVPVKELPFYSHCSTVKPDATPTLKREIGNEL